MNKTQLPLTAEERLKVCKIIAARIDKFLKIPGLPENFWADLDQLLEIIREHRSGEE